MSETTDEKMQRVCEVIRNFAAGEHVQEVTVGIVDEKDHAGEHGREIRVQIKLKRSPPPALRSGG